MPWHVSKIETNMERRANRLAPTFGLKAFLPFVEQRVDVQGRKQTRDVLMFPGYLFVNFDDLSIWKRARREGFVFKGLLGAGDVTIETLKDEIVEELMARHVNGVVPLVEPPPVKLKIGQPVIIERGRYSNVRGLIEGTSADRVEVLLSMFNRQFNVSLPFSAVRAA